MATFTITTPVNVDSLASKAGSDTYAINGGYLTVDQDTRYGVNAGAVAAMGNITMSGTLGGTIEFNATKVRIIPFNNGSGVVPAYNTNIVQGSATGKLIAVYSALNVIPVAPGAAMPVSGYIKIKQWNSVAYAAGALTNITATATGPDRVGWIEIVGVDAMTCTVNRLNTFKVLGDWFDVGVTSGIRTTTYILPTNGAYWNLAGVWVETDVADAYEFYPCAGLLSCLDTLIATDAIRGKACWIGTDGRLWLGGSSSNFTGGYCPPADRKIRIPNIFFMTCIAAATDNSRPNATAATRFDFTTTGAGVIDIEKCCMNWYPIFQQAYSVRLKDIAICNALLISEVAAPIEWSNVNVGQEAQSAQIALSMATCYAGGTITDCHFTVASIAGTGRYSSVFTDVIGFTFTRCQIRSFSTKGHATTGAMNATRMSFCSFIDTIIGCGRLLITTCNDITFTNTIAYDHPWANTLVASFPHYLFDLLSSCVRIKIDGVSYGGISLVQYASGLLSVGAAGCQEIRLRNVGTPAVPLDMGGARVDGASWAQVTTVCTVTTASPHGLRVGDIIYVIVSSGTASVPIGSKTLTAAATTTTFTFACTTGSLTAQTLSYYPTVSGYVCALASAAAANTVRLQRVYTEHTRTGTITGDNSSKNILLESVWGDFFNVALFPMLNTTVKGQRALPAYTGQQSCYGTHWIDNFIAPVTENISGVAWARGTTVCTVTSADHGFWTGLTLVVTESSNTAAIILGIKSVTVLTKDTFTFTCVNSGTTSGTLSFTPLTSKIALLMNEQTAETAGVYTIDAGTPGFTSAGGLFMPVIGDQVTLTTPYYILGHTGFAIAEPIMATGTLANYDIAYALDLNDGLGFGAFHNLYYARPGGSGSSAAYTFTVTSGVGVEIGDYAWGTNVGYNARVTNVATNTITVDKPNIGTVSGIIRFGHLGSETGIDASKGIKFQWRIKTAITNTTAISSLYVWSLTTTASRAYQYPLDLVTMTLDSNVSLAGAEIRVYDLDNAPAGSLGSELAGIESCLGSTFSFTLEAGNSIWVQIMLPGYVEFGQQTVSPSTNGTFTALLAAELNN